MSEDGLTFLPRLGSARRRRLELYRERLTVVSRIILLGSPSGLPSLRCISGLVFGILPVPCSARWPIEQTVSYCGCWRKQLWRLCWQWHWFLLPAERNDGHHIRNFKKRISLKNMRGRNCQNRVHICCEEPVYINIYTKVRGPDIPYLAQELLEICKMIAPTFTYVLHDSVT